MVAPHDICWTGAAPLWSRHPSNPGAILKPDLVRFESDEFMDELTAILAKEAATRTTELWTRLAKPESHQDRPPGAPRDWSPARTALKLYQPIHGHFNLVLSTLVCRIPGLPDHGVDLASGDVVGFVLRRLHADGREMAWVSVSPQEKRWQPIAVNDATRLAEHEEIFPMFQMPSRDATRTRRLWVGLVPTSSRDTFNATREVVPGSLPGASPTPSAPVTHPPAVPDPTVTDARYIEARARVIEGLQTLRLPYLSSNYTEAERETSRFFLLDLADLLAMHLPVIWDALTRRAPPVSGTPARALYGLIDSVFLPAPNAHVPLREALVSALGEWDRITGENATGSTLTYNLRNLALDPGDLAGALDAAFGEAHPEATGTTGSAGGTTTATPPRGPELPRFDDAEARYVVRCIYRRTRCRPPHPDVIGERSPDFAIAPFFDPDAPARPVRIALPVDTSVKGLRRFRKSVAFLVSSQLRKQMSQAADLQGLLDKNVSSGEDFSIGEICSLSIPIITMCAFIVLMIFMILLNFVFWWLPLLKFCFPIPRRGR